MIEIVHSLPAFHENVRASADQAARLIPPVWPLAPSVAVNPFLGHAAETLWATGARLGRASATRVTMPRSWYRERIASGAITDEDLLAALPVAPAELRPRDVAALRAASERDDEPVRALPTVASLCADASRIDWPGLVAHLAREELVSLLGLLASRRVEEDAEHHRSDSAVVVALTPGGDPSDLVAIEDAEVGLVGTEDGARRREGRPDPVAVGRMDARGQVLEGHAGARRKAPEPDPPGIHDEGVVVDVPGPQGDPCGLDGQPQVLCGPTQSAIGSRCQCNLSHRARRHP